MAGVVLPGDSTVSPVTKEVPEPGHGQVLLRMKASSICGSDIRAIYREHLGHGPEAYQGVVAGHEPCGQVVEVGPGCRRLAEGDRVVVYHISGCGLCEECRRGYLIGCTDPSRAAEQGADRLAFLRDPDLFGDLVEDERFTTEYVAALDSLHEHGARATLETWEKPA
jgi:threonine dehydrogenase-like Zn-dependent dehydrogenase